MREFFVARTHERKEFAVEEELATFGLETYCPAEYFITFPRHRKSDAHVEVKRPLFPGYLFIRFPSMIDWNLLRGTFGFVGLLSCEGRPIPVPQSSVAMIQVETGFPDMPEYKNTKYKYPDIIVIGDDVKVKGGVFKGKRTTIKEIVEDQAIVNMMMLGHEFDATIPVSLLKKIKTKKT